MNGMRQSAASVNMRCRAGALAGHLQTITDEAEKTGDPRKNSKYRPVRHKDEDFISF